MLIFLSFLYSHITFGLESDYNPEQRDGSMKLFQRFGVEQNDIGSHHHDDTGSFSGAPPWRRDGEVIATPLTRNGALDPPSLSLLFPGQEENMPFHHPALHQSLIISSRPITQLLRPRCPVHFRRRGVHLIHRLFKSSTISSVPPLFLRPPRGLYVIAALSAWPTAYG